MALAVPYLVNLRVRLTKIARVSSRLEPHLGAQASVVSSSAVDLGDCLWELQRALLAVVAGDERDRSLASLPVLHSIALIGLRSAQRVTTPRRAELDLGVIGWLTEHGMSGEGALSPAFVQGRLGEPFLDEVLDAVGESALSAVLQWLGLTVEAELLLGCLESCTGKLGLLLRSPDHQWPSRMVTTPMEELHELLTGTLELLPARCPACGWRLPLTAEPAFGPRRGLHPNLRRTRGHGGIVVPGANPGAATTGRRRHHPCDVSKADPSGEANAGRGLCPLVVDAPSSSVEVNPMSRRPKGT